MTTATRRPRRPASDAQIDAVIQQYNGSIPGSEALKKLRQQGLAASGSRFYKRRRALGYKRVARGRASWTRYAAAERDSSKVVAPRPAAAARVVGAPKIIAHHLPIARSIKEAMAQLRWGEVHARLDLDTGTLHFQAVPAPLTAEV